MSPVDWADATPIIDRMNTNEIAKAVLDLAPSFLKLDNIELANKVAKMLGNEELDMELRRLRVEFYNMLNSVRIKYDRMLLDLKEEVNRGD